MFQFHKSKSLMTLSMLFLFSTLCYGQGPSLDDLTLTEADEVAREFSANFTHSPVSSAATLGDVFGFEVGVVGGLTNTPEINKLSQRVDPGSDEIDKLPHAAIYGALTVPLGITAEVNLIPSLDLQDVELKNISFGVKWTFSQFLDLPLDIAARVYGGNSSLSYEDEIDGLNAEIEFETKSFGFNISLSKKFLFFEPYIGIGRVSNKTTIGTKASGGIISIFLPSEGITEDYESDNSGSHFFVGANLNLFFFKAGIEYSKVTSVERYTGKLSFYF